MTTERWDRVKRIAGEALDLDAAQRAAFVAAACGGDADLLAEVSSLLAADDPSGRFLEPDRPPAAAGPYRIVREIGRGGMGAVYEGERADGQFEQRVAIKIVKRGMDTDAVLRRFYAERQILARLQHPHIARLLDGGMTADGRPYFVMEYLDAEPIAVYCRERALPLRARVDLLIAVCDAVEYAHSHLVLHRDLKPANILVDAGGAVKLLDFGIAKLLDENEDERAGGVTEAGQRAMTPLYASPEQRRGELLTTASDVYALGLLLQELVPDRERRGDLDRIARKALEDDPARRYRRAAALGDDLRRYQHRRPVTARPSGVAYRAQKYASRHWRGLAVVAIAALIAGGAVVNAIVQGRRAERHFREVRQLANSFMFEFHDAIAKLPGSTPARELVVKRALQYLDGLAGEASNDVDLKRELAQSYQRVGDAQGLYYESNLGRDAESLASFEKARALFADVLRARPSDERAQADLAIATLRVSSGYQERDPARAVALMQEAVASLKAIVDRGSTDPRVRLALGNGYFGIAEATIARPDDSLRARDESIRIYRGVVASQPSAEATRWLSQSLKRRAALYVGMKDPGRAAPDLIEAATIDEQRVARDPSDAVAQMDLSLGLGYASVLHRQTGDLIGAIALLNRAMAIRTAILEADPRNARARTLLNSDRQRLAALLAEQARRK